MPCQANRNGNGTLQNQQCAESVHRVAVDPIDRLRQDDNADGCPEQSCNTYDAPVPFDGFGAKQQQEKMDHCTVSDGVCHTKGKVARRPLLTINMVIAKPMREATAAAML